MRPRTIEGFHKRGTRQNHGDDTSKKPIDPFPEASQELLNLLNQGTKIILTNGFYLAGEIHDDHIRIRTGYDEEQGPEGIRIRFGQWNNTMLELEPAINELRHYHQEAQDRNGGHQTPNGKT